HNLALRAYGGTERGLFDFFTGGSRPKSEPMGNVVLLPGIMGSELTTTWLPSGGQDTVWLSIPRVLFGQLDRLRLAANGVDSHDPRYRVRPSGFLKRYYGEAQLSLARRWNVKAFWFDWRKDLD